MTTVPPPEGVAVDARQHDINVIVMSSAGKPIYARHGSEGDIGRICGLVQAVRSTLLTSTFISGGGDIRSLRSGNLCVVFMAPGELTLVAIGSAEYNSR